ncbi:MAG: Re/Si-specific NAD(P)(+) transhydrogenase subunit alpha [Candidatus Krumholzibacteria bacterium]|nr:Re/Si-specific NAD(P)(+) transhydrogenase subunit alpha [Candidatus Krumholzibacteria bacterium]
MIVGIARELGSGEKRVALVPASVLALVKAGLQVLIEDGAGENAGYPTPEYESKGAEVVARADLFTRADIILQINGPGVDAEQAGLATMKAGQVLIGMQDPLGNPTAISAMAQKGVTAFSLEMVPRITRAQSMDVLSSMATVAGYQAVLEAASQLPRLFPMLMTAAGTLAPAKVFVVGVGVAGLQAIATAKRLGAVVEAYDVRPAVRDQVLSVGAKFVEFDLETESAEDKGGYAKEQSDEFIRRQQEQMLAVVARNDVVITTAAIPGRKSPVLVTAPMVEAMAPGSVIVDLAAERGGNCELTKADEHVVAHGVTILGPTNLVSRKPYHASQMFAKNAETFLKSLLADGKLNVDLDDEVTAGTLLCREGEVVHPRVRDLLNLPPLAPVAGAEPVAEEPAPEGD